MKQLIYFLILISPGQIFSQNLDGEAFLSSVHEYITVTGHVVDKYEGDTLWYVNISVKNNKARNDSIPVATISEKGYYSIHARLDDILVFSAIGYNTQEIAIGGRTVIDVEMDCEDCGRYFPGKWERSAVHDVSILATDVFNRWNYGAEYAYLPRVSNPYNFLSKVMWHADLNLRVQGLSHSGSDLRIFPHMRIYLPFSIPYYTTHKRMSPFVYGGYYFDTSFKSISEHDWGVGAGIKTRLAFVNYKNPLSRDKWNNYRYMNINLVTGYTAYMGDKKKNNFYLGLSFYLSRPFYNE